MVVALGVGSCVGNDDCVIDGEGIGATVGFNVSSKVTSWGGIEDQLSRCELEMDSPPPTLTTTTIVPTLIAVLTGLGKPSINMYKTILFSRRQSNYRTYLLKVIEDVRTFYAQSQQNHKIPLFIRSLPFMVDRRIIKVHY
jgi:hypothetical protein